VIGFICEEAKAILSDTNLLQGKIFHSECEVEKQRLVGVLRQGNLAWLLVNEDKQLDNIVTTTAYSEKNILTC
jgi:hypothetical protein